MTKPLVLAGFVAIGMLAAVGSAQACSVPANICVYVPADARILIDGNVTLSTGVTRYFTTPPIATGQVFTYELRCERVVDGKVVAEARSVKVRPDQVTVVHFGDAVVEKPAAATVAVSSTVEVRKQAALTIGLPRLVGGITSVTATPAASVEVRQVSVPATGSVRVSVRQRAGILAPRFLRVEGSISR